MTYCLIQIVLKLEFPAVGEEALEEIKKYYFYKFQRRYIY